MKNILIPTDFNMASFRCIEPLLKQLGNEQLNIIWVHIFSISDSLIDLLKLSQRNKDYEFISEEFRDRCSDLERDYPDRIHSVRILCFYGSTVAIFKNFLEANHIDLVVQLENYNFQKLSKTSLEPSTLISRCGKKVVRINPGNQEKSFGSLEWLKNAYLNAVN